ncbi:uncharacterized protein LOC144781666 [Lissotriton helveticus]
MHQGFSPTQSEAEALRTPAMSSERASFPVKLTSGGVMPHSHSRSATPEDSPTCSLGPFSCSPTVSPGQIGGCIIQASSSAQDLNETRRSRSNIKLKPTANEEKPPVPARPVWIPKIGDLIRERIAVKKEFGPSYRKAVPVLAVSGTRSVVLPPLAGKKENRVVSIDLVKPQSCSQ